MNKRLKILVENVSKIFNTDFIDRVAKKSKFSFRKRKLNPKEFVSLCVFSNDDLCNKSLNTLCSRLKLKEDIDISAEGLNQRFNKEGVDFLNRLFKELLWSQKKLLKDKEDILKSYFDRITITDSTAFKAPKSFSKYCVENKLRDDPLAKIQLEYDILNGEFICCDIVDGYSSDQSFLSNLLKYTKEKDLKIRDLGYFKISHLKEIEAEKAYYLSRLKNNVNVFIKEKESFTKIDFQNLVNSLEENETIEFSEVYLGKDKKIKSRLIVTKLNEENKKKKLETTKDKCRQRRQKFTSRNENLAAINSYITNVPYEMLPTEIVYELYSTRWQIEILFKIWKSIFDIHLNKNIKLERFYCYLYGKLISVLLGMSIIFDYRDYLFLKEETQVSEYKSFDIFKETLPNLKDAIFQDELSLIRYFNFFESLIVKFAIKCKKKGKKSYIEILKGVLLLLNDKETVV